MGSPAMTAALWTAGVGALGALSGYALASNTNAQTSSQQVPPAVGAEAGAYAAFAAESLVGLGVAVFSKKHRPTGLWLLGLGAIGSMASYMAVGQTGFQQVNAAMNGPTNQPNQLPS
jgi:hypothetical protein